MRYQFTLPNFHNTYFEMKISTWLGKQILCKDDILVEQSTEKRKPFLTSDTNGNTLKVYPKTAIPEIVPDLEINNKKYTTVEKLPWYQMVFALLPLLH